MQKNYIHILYIFIFEEFICLNSAFKCKKKMELSVYAN